MLSIQYTVWEMALTSPEMESAQLRKVGIEAAAAVMEHGSLQLQKAMCTQLGSFGSHEDINIAKLNCIAVYSTSCLLMVNIE